MARPLTRSDAATPSRSLRQMALLITVGAASAGLGAVALVAASVLVDMIGDVVVADGTRDAVILAATALGVCAALAVVTLRVPARRLERWMPWAGLALVTGIRFV